MEKEFEISSHEFLAEWHREGTPSYETLNSTKKNFRIQIFFCTRDFFAYMYISIAGLYTTF